jgi:hypothetical protein
LHLSLSFVLVWLCSWLNLTAGRLPVDSLPQVLLFSGEMAVGGCLLGGWLFGLYLMLSSRLTGAHTNDVFASQSLEGFKNFLRLQIDARGKLTVYPLGIPQVPRQRDWRYRGGDPSLRPGDAWFEPPGGAIGVELIGGKAIEIT